MKDFDDQRTGISDGEAGQSGSPDTGTLPRATTRTRTRRIASVEQREIRRNRIIRMILWAGIVIVAGSLAGMILYQGLSEKPSSTAEPPSEIGMEEIKMAEMKMEELEADTISDAGGELAIPEVPAEVPEPFAPKAETPFVNLALVQEQYFAFDDHAFLLGTSTLEAVKQSLGFADYEDTTEGRRKLVQLNRYADAEQWTLVFYQEGNEWILGSVEVLSPNMGLTRFVSALGVRLGADVSQLEAYSGLKRIPAELLDGHEDQYVYVDLVSQTSVLWEDLPDYRDGKLDRVVIEKTGILGDWGLFDLLELESRWHEWMNQ
jgi:hypothetical protein